MYVMVQIYPAVSLNFYFTLFLCMVIYDEYKTKENKNRTKPENKIEPQHVQGVIWARVFFF